MASHDEIIDSLGLAHNPFPSGAIRDGVFLSRGARDAFREIEFGITSRKGFIVLSGEAGTGKTTLLLRLLDSPGLAGTDTAYICNSMLTGAEILSAVALDLGLTPQTGESRAEVLARLQAHILDCAAKGRNPVIAVDEAHNLERPALEALRMLSNLEADGIKLVQIVLAGQPELDLRLAEPELRQLRGRVGVRAVLAGLEADEIGPYVDFRLAAAGSPLRLEPGCAELLNLGCAGNLRLLNLVMERSLYALSLHGGDVILRSHVRAALEDVGRCQSEVLVRLRFRRRTRALAVAAVLALLPVIFLALAWVRNDSPLTAAIRATSLPGQVSADRSDSSTPAAALLFGDSQAFLAAAGLTPDQHKPVAEALRLALELREPQLLPAALPEDLELLRLDVLPATGSGAAFLTWRRLTGGGPVLLGLWRPPYRVREFHPGGRSAATLALQRDLAALGHLAVEGDGTVGLATWKAVTAFQKSVGLPVSGQPDAETVYLLTSLRSAK